MTLVFDLETDGLLNDATKIHCIAIYDSETKKTTSYNDECPGKGMSEPVVRAVQYLEQADSIVGHNIIGFDIPVIRRLYPFFNFTGTVIDTLILSRLYHNRIIDIKTKKILTKKPIKTSGNFFFAKNDRIYYTVLNKERRGNYLGSTVQIIHPSWARLG